MSTSRDGEPASVAGCTVPRDLLREELRRAQVALHEKNLALDAAYYVWCDGGCHTGILRWQEEHDAPPLTEEIVQEAERQVIRLRRWFESGKNRRRRGFPSAPGVDKLVDP